MLLFIVVGDNIEKQSFADILQNKFSKKFRYIYRKTPSPTAIEWRVFSFCIDISS